MATRRKVSAETQRILVSRQAALTALTKHPSWPELEAEVERKRKRVEKGIITKALVLEAPVDPVEMAYFRGLVDGIEWFVKVPSRAEASLERFLREQGVLEGVEQ